MPARPWILIALTLLAARARADGHDDGDRPDRIDLSLLFVGTLHDGARAPGRARRTQDFVDYLATQFRSVTAADRDHFDPALGDDADVVLLDWSQQEVDLASLKDLPSPLGTREAWRHPTVLLGSAGLLLAGPWQLKGGYG